MLASLSVWISSRENFATIRFTSPGPVKAPTVAWLTRVGRCAVTT